MPKHRAQCYRLFSDADRSLSVTHRQHRTDCRAYAAQRLRHYGHSLTEIAPRLAMAARSVSYLIGHQPTADATQHHSWIWWLAMEPVAWYGELPLDTLMMCDLPHHLQAVLNPVFMCLRRVRGADRDRYTKPPKCHASQRHATNWSQSQRRHLTEMEQLLMELRNDTMEQPNGGMP